MFLSVLWLLACGESTSEEPAAPSAPQTVKLEKKTDPSGKPAPAPLKEGEQTYAAGVQALCDAWQTCPNCRDAEASKAAFNLNRHVEKVVTNREVISMFWNWSNQTRPERAVALKEAQTRAELETCHIARMFQTP